MSTETRTIEELATQEYKYGFVTDVEADAVPRGLNEDIIRLISAQEGRAGVAARVAAEGLPALAHDEGARLGERQARPDRLPGHRLLLGAQAEGRCQSLDEVDPEIRRTFEKLGIPLEEQKALAGVAVDAVFDSVSVATTFKGKLAELGIIFCSFSEAVREHPDLVRQYLGSVVPHSDNFFAALNSAVFTDGSFCYMPKGVRCPMELSTYFRINAAEHRAVRADADRRRRGRVRQLPRGLHGADARREPAARRGRRTGGARQRARSSTRRCRTGIPATRTGKGGIYNFVTKRGHCRGVELEDHLDAGGDRLGDHLEVPELHPAGRQLGGRVLLGGGDEQLPAGRHRHEDDPPREEHAQHDRLEGDLGRPRAEHVPRHGEDREERRRARATTRSATRC